MDSFFALLMLALSLFTIKKMIKSKSALWLMMGLIGIFSIGYYVLPMFFQKEAGLSNVNYLDLISVFVMSTIFFASLLIGVVVTDRKAITRKIYSLKFNMLDGIYLRNYKFIFFIGFVIWLTYYFNTNLTVYEAKDAKSYFLHRSALSTILSILANFGLSAMAISLAIAIKQKEKIKNIMLLLYFTTVVLLLATAQRLSVITPIFMLVAALSLYGNHKKGIQLIFVGVAFLFFVSPLMVFLRELHSSSSRNNALQELSKYKTQDMTTSAFQSIMGRADLLLVMTELKQYIDRPTSKFDTSQYMLSVLTTYIPRLIYPNKPYPLSDTGTIRGEISVVAWHLRRGDNSLGSLSAFGAISAYREGGWLWVPINGFLTGILFVWIYIFLGKGDNIAKLLFISLFMTLSIKNIPPSFFYFLVYISATMQIIIILYFLNKILQKYKKN